jgi:hypothetical protein
VAGDQSVSILTKTAGEHIHYCFQKKIERALPYKEVSWIFAFTIKKKGISRK